MRTAKVGLEVELFTLDMSGKLVNRADELIHAVSDKKCRDHIRPEIGTAMIEVGAVPKQSARATALAFFDCFEELLHEAEKLQILLLPLGAHPAKTYTMLRSKPWYDAQRLIVGNDAFANSAKIAGFHFHYTLPARIVTTERIRTLKRSQSRDIFINQYNFLIASDPALLLFSQSSPFWQGFHYGKDCRAIVYRDFEVIKGASALRGLYYHLPFLGSLPDYEFTLEDLRFQADDRKSEWIRLLQLNRFKQITEITGVPALKFIWGPLRVNKIGTFEYRGPDMNHFSVIFSIAALLRYALSALEMQGLRAVPSDIGITEPFKIEGDTIYLPPHATLKHLEYQAAVNGFDSNAITHYARRFLSCIQRISALNKSPLIKPIRTMVREKKTASDRLLSLVKKSGHDLDMPVPDSFLEFLACSEAKKVRKDIDELRGRILSQL